MNVIKIIIIFSVLLFCKLGANEQSIFDIVPSKYAKSEKILNAYLAAAQGDISAKQEPISSKPARNKSRGDEKINIAQANDWLVTPYIISEKAKLGDMASMVHLGRIYSKGYYGVVKDVEHAAKIFDYAADLGSAKACVEYAWLNANGLTQSANAETAKKYFRMAFECDSTNYEAAYYHGIYLIAYGDHSGAKSLYDKMIASNIEKSIALGYLGLAELNYSALNGYNDIGTKYLIESAKHGGGGAMEKLAILYAESSIENKNETALGYLNKAIEANINDALYTLGCWYSNGTVVPKDDKKAIHYHEIAASKAHERSIKWLIRYYSMSGDDVLSKRYFYRLTRLVGAEAYYFQYKVYSVSQQDSRATTFYQSAKRYGSNIIAVQHLLDQVSTELCTTSYPDVENLALSFMEHLCRSPKVDSIVYTELMGKFLSSKVKFENSGKDAASAESSLEERCKWYIATGRDKGALKALLDGYKTYKNKGKDFFSIKMQWAKTYGFRLAGMPDNII